MPDIGGLHVSVMTYSTVYYVVLTWNTKWKIMYNFEPYNSQPPKKIT